MLTNGFFFPILLCDVAGSLASDLRLFTKFDTQPCWSYDRANLISE
jgi:hypothetical protein